MIQRYSDQRIDQIWSLEHKYGSWQTVELAVIKARELLGQAPPGTHGEISSLLESRPIDAAFIDELEKM